MLWPDKTLTGKRKCTEAYSTQLCSTSTVCTKAQQAIEMFWVLHDIACDREGQGAHSLNAGEHGIPHTRRQTWHTCVQKEDLLCSDWELPIPSTHLVETEMNIDSCCSLKTNLDFHCSGLFRSLPDWVMGLFHSAWDSADIRMWAHRKHKSKQGEDRKSGILATDFRKLSKTSPAYLK